MRVTTALILLGGAATTGGAAPAASIEETPESLDEIIVVATKRETSIRDVAADVTVLERADLDATLSTSLADALRYIPGITHESSGSRFGTEGISIRGIGGNRIAMELDGVPLSDQFDIGNFSNATRDFADTGLIGQMEIMRGPASALYGGSALGGIVSMRTLAPNRGREDRKISGSAGGLYRGVDASSNAQANLTLHLARASLVVAGSLRDGHERQSAALERPADRQRYRRDAALLKVVGENRLGHGWQVSAVRQRYELQTSVTSVLGSGRFSATTGLEGDDRHAMDIFSAEYRFASTWLNDGLLRVFLADADISQHTLDERAAARSPANIARYFSYEQRRRGLELNLWRDREIAGWSHRFGAGLEYTESRTRELRDGLSTSLVDGSTTNVILGESFPLRDFPITSTRELGAYVSDQVDRGALSLLLGLRFDQNRLTPSTDAIFAADNPSTSVVAVSNSDLSPKLGVIHHIGDDIDVYLQYARGFRAPPFEDANIGLDIPLFNIRAIPNPELNSETSDGWELGLRWQGERMRLQLSAFRTDYEDFIETKVRIGTEPESGRLLFQSINIGDAGIQGIEARWAQDLSGRLNGVSLHAAAYLAEGENRDNGQPLNSVGPAEAVFGVTWRSPGERTEVRAQLTATGAWSRRDESAGEFFEPAGHAVLDLFWAHTIHERLTIRAGVGNITDRTYWRWSEVRGLEAGDVLLPTLAESGRHYSLGLQWGW
ncbi:MAG: TonB-dependent receptor [Gammaproteobacteria bacterium]|nr:TonB-dependent receptor [Gammaproteobacteria bacterium]